MQAVVFIVGGVAFHFSRRELREIAAFGPWR
jgi:hypothetical protein